MVQRGLIFLRKDLVCPFPRKLGLDLVVRDDTGDIINLEETGVIDLYKRVSFVSLVYLIVSTTILARN